MNSFINFKIYVFYEYLETIIHYSYNVFDDIYLKSAQFIPTNGIPLLIPFVIVDIEKNSLI